MPLDLDDVDIALKMFRENPQDVHNFIDVLIGTPSQVPDDEVFAALKRTKHTSYEYSAALPYLLVLCKEGQPYRGTKDYCHMLRNDEDLASEKVPFVYNKEKRVKSTRIGSFADSYLASLYDKEANTTAKYLVAQITCAEKQLMVIGALLMAHLPKDTAVTQLRCLRTIAEHPKQARAKLCVQLCVAVSNSKSKVEKHNVKEICNTALTKYTECWKKILSMGGQEVHSKIFEEFKTREIFEQAISTGFVANLLTIGAGRDADGRNAALDTLESMGVDRAHVEGTLVRLKGVKRNLAGKVIHAIARGIVFTGIYAIHIPMRPILYVTGHITGRQLFGLPSRSHPALRKAEQTLRE